MITLDKTREFSEIFSTDSDNKVRFVQDGVKFDAAGKVIGDAAEIARAKREEAVRKAKEELARREAELNAEAASLGLNTQVVDVDAIRAEVEAKVRAEVAAKAEAEAEADLAADVKVPTPPVTPKAAPKTAPKKPGPQAEESTSAA